MAKAIKQIELVQPSAQEEQAQDIAALLEQLAENREAISSAIDIISQLQKAGILDIIQGFLHSKEKVAAIAIEQVNQPNMHNIIRNGFNTVDFLGSLDPQQMNIMMNAVTKGLDKSADVMKKNEKRSMWGLIKALRDPDANLAINSMLGFLKGMGKEMGKKHTHYKTGE
ncbi:uncharacterized protein YjgD (DUF1641 family) [Cytobacillus oceanisediminis]|uniref:Uncharacterized protein YjgD (DUF1641 family) n=1 Tax=Cytobacillus oceanisediminis TaxID=665099 RepID=A0A2V3A7F5_9BACI|nr:DUF1641 domain-containing protein [Cytobacillus oceanisediminis]PWW32010.1 uncharacterized protein YjgD (DUF1641 family) [Cytobacillus oceanisediminis]